MDDVVRPGTCGQALPEPPLWEVPASGEPLPLPAAGAVPLIEEDTSESADQNPTMAALERLETAMTGGFASLLDELRDRLVLDRFKEEQITKLHEELQAYRNDLVHRTARQILQGLVRLHDDLGKVVTSLRQKPAEELTPERFFQQMDGLRDDVELILGQHGVEPFQTCTEDFDPRRQTALRMVCTADAALVGRVAERLRPGFAQGEALLQKERVAVYAAAGGNDERQ